jgi:hypothetical protein
MVIKVDSNIRFIKNLMKSRGRSQDQALLRTLATKKYQTYSHKRLIKDLE